MHASPKVNTRKFERKRIRSSRGSFKHREQKRTGAEANEIDLRNQVDLRSQLGGHSKRVVEIRRNKNHDLIWKLDVSKNHSK